MNSHLTRIPPILGTLTLTLALTVTLPGHARSAASIVEEDAPAVVLADQNADLARAQQQIEAAQRQIEVAQARVEAAAEAMAEDQPEPPEEPEAPEPPEVPEVPEVPGVPVTPAMPDVAAIVNGAMAQVHTAFGNDWNSLTTGTPLILASRLNAKQRDELQEDLTVMARILSKSVAKASAGAKSRKAMGITIQPWGRSAPSSLYLENYGPLFLLHVGYPLVAPPAKTDKAKADEKPVDPTWEETRAELYGNRNGKRATLFGANSGPGSQVEYDGERVDALKRALLEAARNAANLRGVEPSESITIAVQGTAQPQPKRPEATNLETRDGGKVVLLQRGGGGPATLMTIRFAKSDADALAANKLTAAEFAGKAVVNAY